MVAPKMTQATLAEMRMNVMAAMRKSMRPYEALYNPKRKPSEIGETVNGSVWERPRGVSARHGHLFVILAGREGESFGSGFCVLDELGVGRGQKIERTLGRRRIAHLNEFVVSS